MVTGSHSHSFLGNLTKHRKITAPSTVNFLPNDADREEVLGTSNRAVVSTFSLTTNH